MDAEHLVPPDELYEKAVTFFEGVRKYDKVLVYGDGDPDGMTAAVCVSEVLDARLATYDVRFTRGQLNIKDVEQVARGRYNKVYCTDFWEIYESPVEVVADMVEKVKEFAVYDHHDIRTSGRENLDRLYEELDRRGIRDRFTLINPNLEGVADVPNGSAWEYRVAERYVARHPRALLDKHMSRLKEVATAGAILDYCAPQSADLVAEALLEHPESLDCDRKVLRKALDDYQNAAYGDPVTFTALKDALPSQNELLGSTFGIAGRNTFANWIVAGWRGAQDVYKAAKAMVRGTGSFNDLVEDNGRFPEFFKNVNRVEGELASQYAIFDEDLASHEQGEDTTATSFDDELQLAVFQYSSENPLRFASHLSTNLRDQHPEFAWFVYQVNEEKGWVGASLRLDEEHSPQYDLARAVTEASKGIDGARGGGHSAACGASMAEKDLPLFIERVKEELRQQLKGSDE